MTDSALKPCPFCGGVGHMAKDPDMNWGDFYSIKCGTCRAKSPEFHASETCPIFFAQVRDAWNRRADLAPDPLGAVKVKPLVWHRADLSAWGEYADAGLLRYRMTWTYRDDPEVWFTMKCEHDGKVLYQGGDEDAAIRAANEDCAARIRSALEPCDPLSDPRVMALVGALREIAEEPCMDPDGNAALARAALAALSPTGGNDE